MKELHRSASTIAGKHKGLQPGKKTGINRNAHRTALFSLKVPLFYQVPSDTLD